MNGRQKIRTPQRLPISYRLSAHCLQSQESGIQHTVSSSAGFTLFELLASIAILAIISTLLFAAFNQTTRVWLQEENRVETFQQARAALDFMARELSQAMVNTNLPFFANANSLAFIAPIARQGSPTVDLAEIVYRLSYAPPSGTDPDGLFVNSDAQPPLRLVRRVSYFNSTNCRNYANPSISCSGPWDFYNTPSAALTWPQTSDYINNAVLADNVIFLRMAFYAPNGAAYTSWNSTNAVAWKGEIVGGIPSAVAPLYMINQAPSQVAITLRVIDASAAARLRTTSNATIQSNIWSQAYHDLTTSVIIPNGQP